MNVFSRMQALRTPWLGWWLAMALVLAPALGRMHEVLHAPALQTQLNSAHSHTGLAAWFDGHDAQTCLVFDQLGHGAANTLPSTPIPHALPTQPPVWMCEACLLPAAPRLFLARAPPQDFTA
ncbi:hypothetical protein [Comamonas sp. NoAH]|uniref:hypothetical protein n=1 Tax=Comamonas halotolerans TaxID=3041496 RepID=UPI0024E197B0|nr:hypothetical protein [Comamonas sp. NoAH]